MNKTKYQSIFFSTKITLEKKSLYLCQFLLEKLKEKLIQEILEKERKDELKEKLKRKQIQEAKNRDKKYKLKLISSGFIPSNERLIKTENKIDKELLSPLNQKLINKLDNEIISYAYKDKKNNSKGKNMQYKSENNITIELQ